ncbi:MAG TPA: cytochrome P450 [Solirubrobacteraceae bacterium]|jgi:cytochrome P450|nr:cytochrome P450 [Solirubrobacteraceae bacterium]
MKTQLPPGPSAPTAWQTLAFWSRPNAFAERCAARYGRRFTLRIIGQPPFVALWDPDEIREVFQAPPDVLHPGEGARILEPLVGRHSVILLDEEPHLEQRKLLLPAFHGERMQRLAGLMAQLAEREVESWPRGEPVALHARLQGLTLEIILRAVFGLERGGRLDELRWLLSEILAFAENPLSMLPRPPRALTLRGPIARQDRLHARNDELIYELIAERQRAGEGEEGDDVLAMLLAARHEDGSPMSAEELRDELMTALVAGHETTASELAWGFERLSREPAVLARLHEEIDGDSDEAYLTATVQEILRHRPVLPHAEPRLVKQPVEIGGFTYQPGAILAAFAHLVHHDPAIYPEPQAFRPERFIESEGGKAPGTYTWIPFGGGRRRCLGASFALLEMKLALRAVLERCELQPVGGPERARRRNITVSPTRGCEVIVRERTAKRRVNAPPVAEPIAA